jgi:hypothetical protein
MRLRKALRQLDLVGGQDVHRIVAARFEHRRDGEDRPRLHSTSGGSSDTEAKGIDGDADRLAVRTARVTTATPVANSPSASRRERLSN